MEFQGVINEAKLKNFLVSIVQKTKNGFNCFLISVLANFMKINNYKLIRLVEKKIYSNLTFRIQIFVLQNFDK